ncbi:unnamed protein product [Adineta steineri]|uniref:G-protein coupled receptors family 1 profile domain-containing protein n=1 Tax=Adineta steineri TaxID=433720 RepID=A0A814UV58_9BILA|nr:unnamed protein product [Adineta steineri]CAF1194408.1 unnamed protein product [Adineta steineri]CAF3550496.1 unnamed protein product [Adineta steineri]CAF4163931.1 unnamed protein product [Adineta steineri]
MSSPTLATIQNQLNRYGNSIATILGDIGNIFIIIIFSQQHRNACSLYLVTAAICNTFYITFSCILQYFPFYYLDETVRAFILCKIRYYVPILIAQIAKTMMVFACIDRYMITSNRATFRALSTSKRAKYLIVFSVIFWLLVLSHIAVGTTINNGQCGQFGIYATFYSIFIIIVAGSIPPIVMSVCGYLTYRNMRRLRHRIQPAVNYTNEGNVNIRQRDRDLLIIVINEIFIYVIMISLYPLILLETIISNNTMSSKSAQYLQIETFIIIIASFLSSVNSAAPFYIYFVSSKSFRRDFIQLTTRTYRKVTRQAQTVSVHRITRNFERNTAV